MSMTIEDFGGRHRANNPSELESVLRKTHGPGVNGFWLSHDDDKYPTLALLVNGDLATLSYFPRESHPGFTPAGGIAGLDKSGTTTFSIDTVEQETEIWNEQVVAFSTALSVAKEFFDWKELPQSIEWTEL
jgi:hypothetical protein